MTKRNKILDLMQDPRELPHGGLMVRGDETTADLVGLTELQIQVLTCEPLNRGTATPREIAKALGAATPTKTLRSLVERGLLHFTPMFGYLLNLRGRAVADLLRKRCQ